MFRLLLKHWPDLTIFWIAILLACNSGSETEAGHKTNKTLSFTKHESQFTGTQTCISCHAKEYQDWQGSHHDNAMKRADSTTVLANFDSTTFESNTIKSVFYRRDDKYLVQTVGRDGNPHEYEIVYTFGIHPLQQYIVSFPNGAYQCLQTAWDTEKKEWFDLQPALNIAPDEWLHWTGNAMRWNTACADCHSTDVHKNFDIGSETYHTSFREINVGCESCHGPGSEHVAFYEGDTKGLPPSMYMQNRMEPGNLVQKCARCHSRRSQLTSYFNYKGHFLDHYEPSLIATPVYEPDGQILDEDYVYGSFVQSKMYQNGVTCRDCHNVHSLKLKSEGNALCLTCHDTSYDTRAHHFHQANTEASQCINCHMTGRYYMGNDFRRDHSFRVPRPDQSVKYGTPNACNGCHTDKNAQWAADAVIANYGETRNDHFSDHLLAGYYDDPEQLYKVIAGSGYPEIARATAMHYYASRVSPEQVDRIKKFLNDPDVLVKNETIKTLAHLGSEDALPYIKPLMADPVRLIRLSAFEYINKFAPNAEPTLEYQTVHKEYITLLDMSADFPSGQQRRAQYYENRGDTQNAIRAYQKALEIDNRYNQARMNLALLLYKTGDQKEAERLYLKVIEQEPEASYPYYMLGLLYHETGNNEKAIQYLRQACNTTPPILRAHYNLALALQKKGQFTQSIEAVNHGLMTFTDHEELLYVRLIAELRSEQLSAAYGTCQKLIGIAPENRNYRMILEQLAKDMVTP